MKQEESTWLFFFKPNQQITATSAAKQSAQSTASVVPKQMCRGILVRCRFRLYRAVVRPERLAL